MNNAARQKILNSWGRVNEVALIKDVATKGEYVELCVEYLARRKQISLNESKEFFKTNVDLYVSRLLNEKLVCKAENVLKNVSRDVKSFYYQFAFDTTDPTVKDVILEHLKKRDPYVYEEERQEYEFYWRVLKQLGAEKLEEFLERDDKSRNYTLLGLYLWKKSPELLDKVEKAFAWEYFVENWKSHELIKWLQRDPKALHGKFLLWEITAEMFEFALANLKNPSEVLRNLFAAQGYFFADEKHNTRIVLRRIFTTQSFKKNKDAINQLALAEDCLHNKQFLLLLQDIFSVDDIERLKQQNKQEDLLEVVLTLKKVDLQSKDGLPEISKILRQFFEKQNKAFAEENPFVYLFESLSSGNILMEDSTLPYIKSLHNRLSNPDALGHPTVYELLKSMNQLDLTEITKEFDADELLIFNNPRLMERYAKPFKLTFVDYVRQCRSSYAAYYFMREQLEGYSQIAKSQLYKACEIVTELALRSYNNPDLVSHCVAFCETLGFDTQNLRSSLKCLNFVGSADQQTPIDFEQLSIKTEEKLFADWNHKAFPLAEYNGIVRVANCSKERKWPTLFLSEFARGNDWWKFLVLMQYFEIPVLHVKEILKRFATPRMGKHFLHALSTETTTEKAKRRASFSRHKSRTKSDNSQTTNTSAETMTSSISSSDPNPPSRSSHQSSTKFFQDLDDIDIFAIILQSTTNVPEEMFQNFQKFLEILRDPHSYSTSLNLLKNAIKFKRPVLAVLSAMVSDVNVECNWMVWLAVSTECMLAVVEATKKANDVSWKLVEYCVQNGYLNTLDRSFRIFYENNPFSYLTDFLRRTKNMSFEEEDINQLRMFFVSWSNGEILLPGATHTKDVIMRFAVKLIISHLTHNFTSTHHQRQYLTSICKSGISDISASIDCCFLSSIFEMVYESEGKEFDFEKLVEKDSSECDKLLTYLVDTKRFDDAIQLATLLSLPICDIVYMKWTYNVDFSNLNFDKYETEIQLHSLPPEILVNFLLFSSSTLDSACVQKYLMLKKALDVIKKNHLFPNESFDRDQIEYNMILSYLQLADIAELEIYHSEYFEEIMSKERCVLYKSFMELKELAGIEDLSSNAKSALTSGAKQRLSDLLNLLLDKGDIVEALRLQAMFDHRPIDLHFIVFCMALAEGLTTVYSMSKEERELFKDVEKLSFAKFNKRTINNIRGHASPFRAGEASDSGSAHEFEEIPPKEKKETLEAIQGIASRLKFGVNLGKRIVMSYRAAMYLDKEYLDVLQTKENSILLKSAAYEDCLQKLLVISDIFTSTHMTPNEIADYLSYEIATAIIRPRFYIFSLDHLSDNSNHFKSCRLWGYDLDKDFHLMLELCPDKTALGKCLMSYCEALKAYRKFQDNKPFEVSPTLEKLQNIIKEYGLPNQLPGITQVMSHKKQNLITVEFLIKAHQCFLHECSMEGIANVLNKAKALNCILTSAKSWALIVRMLTGIGRYREMYYCFESLIKNDQFESLLGQFDDEKTAGLRQAIISHIREYCPQNQELLRLAALHFQMYKELAELWEQDATTAINTILEVAKAPAVPDDRQIPVSRIKCGTDVLSLLNQALDSLTHATENYLLDNKLLLAQKSAFRAELAAMQTDLVTKNMSSVCICVLDIRSQEEFREVVNTELSFPQVMIVSRAYSFDINWAEAIFFQFVVLGRKQFLNELLSQMSLTDVIIDNVVKCYQAHGQTSPITPKMDECLSQLVAQIQSVTLRYKLASLLGYKRILMPLINEQSYYLQDTNYGKHQSNI